MGSLTIGQVARRSGVGVETVRFYEREGLIEEPERKESGYRQFSEDVIPRLRVIKRARDLGFSLAEIKELFALRADSSAACGEVRRRAEVKISDIDDKIGYLGKMRGALEEIVSSCRSAEPAHGPCPFLESLNAQDDESH